MWKRHWDLDGTVGKLEFLKAKALKSMNTQEFVTKGAYRDPMALGITGD